MHFIQDNGVPNKSTIRTEREGTSRRIENEFDDLESHRNESDRCQLYYFFYFIIKN